MEEMEKVYREIRITVPKREENNPRASVEWRRDWIVTHLRHQIPGVAFTLEDQDTIVVNNSTSLLSRERIEKIFGLVKWEHKLSLSGEISSDNSDKPSSNGSSGKGSGVYLLQEFFGLGFGGPEKIKKRIQDYEDQIARIGVDVSRLQEEEGKYRTRIAELESAERGLRGSVSSLESRVMVQEGLLTNARTSLDLKEKEASELHAQVEDLKSKRKKDKADYEASESALRVLLNDSRLQWNAWALKCSELGREMQRLDHEKKEYQEKISHLTAVQESLHKSLDEQKSAYDARMKTLDEEIIKLKQEVTDGIEPTRLKGILAEKEKELAGYRSQYEQVTREMKTLETQFSDTTRALGELQGNYHNIQNQLDGELKRVSALVSENERLSKEIEALTLAKEVYDLAVKENAELQGEKKDFFAGKLSLEQQAKDARAEAKNFQDLAKGAHEKIALLEVRIQELDVKAARDPLASLSEDELLAEYVKKIDQGKYQEVAQKYDAVFPRGFDANIVMALPGDLKLFILTHDVRDQCREQGLDYTEPLDDFLKQVRAASDDFLRSWYHQEHGLGYTMARLVKQKQDLGEALPPELEALLPRVPEVIEKYEGAQQQWTVRQIAAQKLMGEILERRDLYEIARAEAEDVIAGKKLEAEIPIVSYAHMAEGKRNISFILPTDAGTKSRNLTLTLESFITASLGDESCFQDKELNVGEVRDAKILRISSSKDNPLPKLSDATLMLQRSYEARALHQLGLRLKVYEMGEQQNG